MVTIIEVQTPYWIYFYNLNATESKENIMAELEKPNYGTIGKYLFFSDDKEELEKLAREILSEYNLYSAKVPKSNVPKPRLGYGFVLCMYDSKPHFKQEMKQYADGKKIRYKYWKSDADTMKGKYTDQFSALK